MLTPTTCLGCGAVFQSDFEQQAGYIEQSSIDRYVAQVQRRIAPHLHSDTAQAQTAGHARAEEAVEHSQAEEEEGTSAATTAAADGEERKEGEEGKAEDGVSGESDLSWQDELRRGELSMADLSSTRRITLLTPRQAKLELRRQKELDDARWHARKTGAPYTPPSPSPSPSSTLPLPKPLRCVRCFQLSHYGHTRGNIATAISSDFRQLLQERLSATTPAAVVLLLVDLLDVHSSIIPHLRSLIARKHAVLLVANKVDLLPPDHGENRMRAWLNAECERYRVPHHALQLVSAKTGEGVLALMRKARELALNRAEAETGGGRAVYLVGAVNTGKSSLINRMQDMRLVQKGGDWMAAGPSLTSSILPGTTLGLVGFPLIPARDGVMMYDTPGVITHPLSSLLTMAELKAVLPSRSLVPVTYRLQEGQSILLGGLARLDHVEGRPFFFTVYTSQSVTVHVTSAKKMDQPVDDDTSEEQSSEQGEAKGKQETVTAETGLTRLFRLHAGSMLSPPFDYERFTQLGLGRAPALLFDLQGRGWMEAGEDVVFPGVGWVAVTGSGRLRVRAFIAGSAGLSSEEEEERVLPFAREPLMPFDARSSTRKFHGSDTRISRRHHQQQQAPTSSSALTTQQPRASAATQPASRHQQQQQQQRGVHSLASAGSSSMASAATSIRRFATSAVTTAGRYFSSSAADRKSGASPSSPASKASLSSPERSTPSTLTSASPPLSSQSPSSSSSTPARSFLPPVAVGRPQWRVYKQLLAQQRAAMLRAYRQTEEYLLRPKGSWRVQADGRLLKLFRHSPNRAPAKEGRFRAQMRRRRERQERKALALDEDRKKETQQ